MTRRSPRAMKDPIDATTPTTNRKERSPKSTRSKKRRRRKKKRSADRKNSPTMRTIWISSTTTKNSPASKRRNNHAEKAMRMKTPTCTTWQKTMQPLVTMCNPMTMSATTEGPTSPTPSQRYKKSSINKRTSSIPPISKSLPFRMKIETSPKLTSLNDILANSKSMPKI